LDNAPTNNEEKHADVTAQTIIPRNEEPAFAHKPNQPHKTHHTWLERSAVAIAVLAFLAAAGQGWVARDTEERGLRAYVAVKSIRFDSNSVAIELDNSGQTPADNVQIFSNWQTRPKGQRETLCKEFSFLDQEQCASTRSSAVLTTHNPLNTPNLICEKVRDDGLRAARGEIDWVLYGDVTYSDVFRKSRTSTFCDFIGPDGATICNCHNEIDPQK
jgi:hypothetical protein